MVRTIRKDSVNNKLEALLPSSTTMKPKQTKTFDPELSADLINMLMDKGFSRKQLARFLRKDSAFLDRIIKKKVYLSNTDLTNLEIGTNQPVLLNLLSSMNKEKPTQKDEKAFREIAEKLLSSTSKLRQISRKHHTSRG